MAEEYKVEIGAQAKESEFDAIEQRIKRITDKEYPITFKIDAKTEKSLGDLKDALDNIGKSNPKLDLNLDVNEITAVKKGLVGLGNTIEKISRVFDALDKSTTSLSGLDGLFTGSLKGLGNVNANLADFKSTFNDIENAIERTITSIDQLKKKTNSFTPSIDLGLKRSASEKNTLIESMSTDLVPDLKDQAEKLMKELNIRDIFDADAFAGKYFKGSVVQYSTRFRELYREAFQGMHQLSKGERQATSVEQAGAYRNLINQLREYATVSGANVSSLDSEFASISDRLKELDNVASGADIDERLKSIFNIDTSKMEASLERIVQAIDKVNEALGKLGQGDPQAFTGITEELRKISEEFGQIKSGLDSFNKSFEAFNGDTKFQDLANSLSSLPQSISQLNSLSTSISQLAGAISVLQQDCDRINQTLTTGARIAQNAGNSYSQIGDAARQVGNIVDQVDVGQVSADQNFLKGLGLDSASIDVITRDLDSVITQVKEVKQVFNKDGQLKLEVKGLDTNGREVSVTRGYKWGKTESGDEILEPYGKLSVKEKFVTEVEEVEEAYKKMQEHLKKMDTLAKSEARADDDFSIDYFHKQYEKEAEEYSKLVAKYWDKFSNQQQIDLINKDRKTKNDVKLINDQKLKKQSEEAEKIIEDAENKIKSKADEIADIEIKIDALKINEGSQAEIDKYTASLQKLREEYNSLYRGLHGQSATPVLTDEAIKKIDEGREYNQKVKAEGIAKQAQKISIDFKAQEFDITKIKTDFDGLKTKTEETKTAVKGLEEALSKLDEAIKSNNNSQIVEAKKAYNLARKTAENAVKRDVEAEKRSRKDSKLDIDKRAFESGMDVWLKRNSEAADHFADKIAYIRQRLKECDATELSQLRTEFTDLKRQAELAGKTVKSFGDRLQDQFKAFGTYFALDNIIDEAIQGVRDMYDQVVQIDSAMTDLYKVTDETPERYSKFLKSSQDGAKELGRSVSSYITQSAKWAQMGYGIDQSEQLAKVSSIYANVADVTDEVAVSDIVSNLKAFGIEAEKAISVVDVLNNLSNKYAVTAAGLGQGLTNSASAMAMSNATFEQTTALLTGIAEITQSPSEAGSFLKVASMRIRGMKGELEELGEEVDSNVDSISKVQTQILNLTGGKVNIFDGNDEFRNYYEIMEDIAKVYNDLSSTEQSNLTEILFGKMRGNQGAAMIQAFQSGQIQKALKDAMTSEGSAYAEQEKWADSLEARIGKISASWQSLSETIMNSDFLKGGMDLLIGFMNGLEGILDQFGTLPTLLAGVMGALSFNDVGELIKQFHYLITLENEYAHEAS